MSAVSHALNTNIYDVLCIGEATIDTTISVPRLPDRDDKVVGKLLSEQVGGTVANCACVCSSLGLKVAAFTNVGNDENGKRITDEYKAHGVSVEYVSSTEGLDVFKVISMLDASGEKSMVLLPSTPKPYSNEKLECAIQKSAYIYTMPNDLDELRSISKLTKKYNKKLVVDIEPTTFKTSEQLTDILSFANIAIFNRSGYFQAFNSAPSHDSLKMLSEKFHLDAVCVTLGQDGVTAYLYDEFACFPAFNITVVDTTGAGDTFNATFLFSIINHYDVTQALRFASASAALAVTEIGPKGLVPTCKSIENFLQTADYKS